MIKPLLKIIIKTLNNFRKVFTKPQFKNFINFIRGMLFKSRKSIRSYSEGTNKNQSSMNRFVNSKAISDNKLIKEIDKIISSNLSRNKAFFIADDTLNHHPHAEKIFGIGKHHDHLNNTYSNSHSILTCGISQDNQFYPTNCDLYIKKVDITQASIFKTKIQLLKEAIMKYKDKVETFLFDSWYSTKEILRLIIEIGKRFVTVIKSNTNFTVNYRKREIRDWGRTIYPANFKIIDVSKNSYAVYSMIGYLPKVGKVKVVFSKKYDKKTCKSGDLFYIVTNDISLSEDEIIQQYSSRWPIETFHKNIKQNLGFEKSIIRKKIGVKRHLILSRLSYLILEIVQKEKKKSYFKIDKGFLSSQEKFLSNGEIQKELKFNYVENILEEIGGLGGEKLKNCLEKLKVVC